MTDDIWEIQDGEPTRWYHIFVQYYLTQGLGRSVTRAFRLFVQADKDISEAEARLEKVDSHWHEISAVWDWKKRAEAYDDHLTELAFRTVEQAGVELRLNAIKAVQALILSLPHERYGVMAAKEILDRAGLPATSRQEIESSVKLTADELTKAAEDVEEWEQTKYDKSS